LVEERLGSRPTLRVETPERVEATEGEHFLELIEHQKRHDRVVAGIPEIVFLAMEVLPQRLALLGGRRLDLMGGGFANNRRDDLRWQVRPLGRKVETDVYRKDILLPEPGEQTCLQQ
jgi:hypothetical protein